MAEMKKAPPKAHELKDLPVPSFLADLKERGATQGGFSLLAREITAAYREHFVHPNAHIPEHIIDRRKLTRLADHDRDVTLSLVELEALHAWFDKIQPGGLTTNPFFTHSGLIQELAGATECSFVLGSRMAYEGAVMSHWDWQAMTRIQRTMRGLSNNQRFDLIDVQTGVQAGGSAEWRKLFAKDGPSLVLLGSPRANRASEFALRKMLQPAPAPGRWAKLPFYFVFHGDGTEPSHFARPLDKFNGEHQRIVKSVQAKHGWGLIAGAESFLSEVATKEVPGRGDRRVLRDRIKSYGIIAAQRRPEGQVWVVIAGLTGPGTFAAADSLRHVIGTLPSQRGACSPVLWGVVCASVDTIPMMQAGKPPELSDPKFVIKPSFWHQRTRGSRSSKA